MLNPSSKSIGLQLALLLLGLVVITPKSQALELLGFEHANLKSGQLSTLDHLKGKPSLMMFFEPECPWCFKQGKAFNRLLAQCDNKVNIVAMGANADRSSLKKTLWKMHLNFDGFEAGPTMMQQVGQLPATPITLLLDEQGNLVSFLRGYVKDAQLQELLPKVLGVSCLADVG